MPARKWVGVLILAIGSLVVLAAIVWAAFSGAPWVKSSASGSTDATPVAWVNEKPISRGTLVDLANTILSTGGSDKAQAYQDALDLLVQNSLFLQEATQRGLIPTDAEVESRVQYLLDQAHADNQQLKDLYAAQAAELGTTWESPEFRAYLMQQTRDTLPAEMLNAQINAQVQGDPQRFDEAKAQLLEGLLAAASIRLDASALPEEARNVHVPQFSELPIAQPAGATSP